MALVHFEDGEAQVLWRGVGTTVAEHKLVLVTLGSTGRRSAYASTVAHTVRPVVLPRDVRRAGGAVRGDLIDAHLPLTLAQERRAHRSSKVKHVHDLFLLLLY